METSTSRLPGSLLERLDLLAARAERAARLMEELRRERDEVFSAAKVRGGAALVRRIEEWNRLELENRHFQEERREAAARLRALIDKVDMLPGGA
ncbi:MAG: hypothetical protein V1774_05300 [Candidatus Eisenbacteria bacterium]